MPDLRVLADAEAAYRAAFAVSEMRRQERNQAIVDALAEGVRPVEVARITGLSRSRIAQLQPARV